MQQATDYKIDSYIQDEPTRMTTVWVVEILNSDNSVLETRDFTNSHTRDEWIKSFGLEIKDSQLKFCGHYMHAWPRLPISQTVRVTGKVKMEICNACIAVRITQTDNSGFEIINIVEGYMLNDRMRDDF